MAFLIARTKKAPLLDPRTSHRIGIEYYYGLRPLSYYITKEEAKEDLLPKRNDGNLGWERTVP